MGKTMINVFISYGHKECEDMVRRVVEDLKAQTDLDVFFDVDCLDRGDWEQLITQGIHRCDWFLFLVSKKSTSLESYCLNELSLACELKKNAIPVLLDDSFVPLSIQRLQRIYFNRCLNVEGSLIDEAYDPNFARLLKVVRGQEALGYFNKDITMEDQLQTFDPYEIGHSALEFQGRKQFFCDFKEWLHSPEALPIYYLEAAPGVGKTAIAAAVATRYTANVAGVHFCVDRNSAKTNPRNIIISLACQLSYRSPEYQDALVPILQKETAGEADVKRLFEIYIIEPCRKIHFSTTQIFVIDALDEAVVHGKNELAEVIVASQDALPSWLRFFFTSRPQDDVRRYFHVCHRFILDERSEENNDDILAFYQRKFAALPFGEKQAKILMEKTHGSFLYAREIARLVKAGELSLDRVEAFPDGIYSYYAMWFDRVFDDGRYSYDEARKILSLLLVTDVAPEISFLSEASGLGEQDVYRYVDALGSFLRVEKECVSPIHKTIIDWLGSTTNCPSNYRIRPKEGYERLYAYIQKARAAGRGWKRNYYVIHDLARCLRELGKYDELCALLQDGEYLNAGLKSSFYGLYGGLEEYMRSLACLYEQDPDYCFDVYDSEAFVHIVSTYRMNIYNAGYFLDLRACGLEDYLSEKGSKIGENISYEIGVVHFFYISLLFQKAAKRLDALLQRYPLSTLDLESRSELERMMLLTYRKAARFDKMEEIAPSAIEDAHTSGKAFEESLDYLTMSKVYCRQLKKEESFAAAEEAVRILKAKVEEETDERNTQMGDHLFLCEDYRVYADAAIWHEEFLKAKELLQKARVIYTRYRTFDRYFPRFLYTSFFLEVARDGRKERIAELLEALDANVRDGKDQYDQSQYYFLLALYYFLESKREPSLLDRVEGLLEEAIKRDKALNVPVELLEAQCLYNLYDEVCGNPPRYHDTYNEHTDRWIAYVEQKIRAWREKR